MDYHFIHSVVDEQYTDIATEKGIQPEYLKELRTYAGLCDCRDSIGASYTFARLYRKGSHPAIFFSRTANKTRAISTCTFSQSVGWNQSGKMLLDDFDGILSSPFLSEQELDELVEAHRPVPPGMGANNNLLPVTIATTAIRAILYGVLFRWMQKTPPVHIVVPKTVAPEAYNQYVLSAVREIYSYFPALMRAEAGFSSYLLAEHEASFQKLYIVFLPEGIAGPNALALDGSTPTAYASLVRSTGSQGLDYFLDYIANCSAPEERRQFLSGVYADIEKRFEDAGKDFSCYEYQKYGAGLALLQEARPAEEALLTWIRFASEKEKYAPGIRSTIITRITETISEEDILRYAWGKVGKDSSLENLFGTLRELTPLCSLNDNWRSALWFFMKEALEKGRYSPSAVSRKLKDNGMLQTLGDAGAYTDYEGEWILRAEEEREKQQIARCWEELNLEIQVNPNTIAEVNAERSKIEKIYNSIPEKIRKDKDHDLVRAVEDRRHKLQEKADSSVMRSRELIDSLGRETNYFSGAIKASKEYGNLSDNDKTNLKKTLREKRPKTIQAYISEFQMAGLGRLSITTIVKCPALIQQMVAEDLLLFANEEQRWLGPENRKTKTHLTEWLVGMQKYFGLVGKEGDESVRIGSTRGTADQMKRLLRLESPFDDQWPLAKRLIDEGVFSGYDVLQLFDLADTLEQRESILRRALSGDVIPDIGEDTYYVLFSSAKKELGRQRLQDLIENTRLCSNAESAWEQFEKKRRRSENSGKSVLFTALAAAVLCMAVSAAGFFLGRKMAPAAKYVEVKENAEETEQEEIKPYITVLENAASSQDARVSLAGLEIGDEDLQIIVQQIVPRLPNPQKEEWLADEELLGVLGYPTDLDLSNNEISHISPLAKLRGLRKLNLEGNNTHIDLSPLHQLPYLQLVCLGNASEEAVRSLCESVPGCFVRWIKDGKTVVSVNDKSYTQDTAAWDLSGQTIRSLEVFSDCSDVFRQLKMLSLAGVPIGDTTALLSVPSLEILDVSDTGLTDEGLAQLLKLDRMQRIILYRNPGLSELTLMDAGDRCLYVQQFPDQTATEKQESLMLDMREQGLQAFPSIYEYSGLYELNLSGNQIKDINFYNIGAGVKEPLRVLRLSGNGLVSLQGLETLTSIEILDLSNNDLGAGTIGYLCRLSTLRLLDISGNPQIGQDELTQLRDALPGCYIISDEFYETPDEADPAQPGYEVYPEASEETAESDAETNSTGVEWEFKFKADSLFDTEESSNEETSPRENTP